jgi:N-acetylmuramoyl-L-alanine amidase
MSYKIHQHLLQNTNVDFVKSTNIGSKFKPQNLDTIVIHYTAGSNRLSSVKTLSNPSKKVSAHLVIGRDNKITQLVPFDTVAWHAGESAHNGRVGLNNYSIGIEIDNAGVLDKSGENFFSWFGKQYDSSEVFEGIHRNETKLKYWHRYLEWQISEVQEICELLVKEYNIKYILGHEEISPKRKIDPGPAFPLDKLRDKIFNADRDSDKDEPVQQITSGKVTVSSLNIRKEADPESEKVANALPQGTKVEILEEKDGWYKVKTELIGWVSAKYVK